MSGGSLLTMLQKSEDTHTVPVSELLSICIEVCSGMKYLEEQKIIHRDLACRNILVTKVEGKHLAKVTDFGIG